MGPDFPRAIVIVKLKRMNKDTVISLTQTEDLGI